MKPTEKSKPFDPNNAPSTRSQYHRVVYANVIRIRMSNIDSMITFSNIVDQRTTKDEYSLEVEDQVSVALSINVAKDLLKALGDAIADSDNKNAKQ